MANRTETFRLTPGALSEGLTAAGLSLKEFCHLFDLNYDTAKRWTRHPDHPRACEPPYWVTPVLAACRAESFLIMAREIRAMESAEQAEGVSDAA